MKLLLVVLVLDTILLVLAVLLQSGRGGGLAGALGALGGGESALGTRATSTIAKVTWGLGTIFLLTCVTMAWLSSSARDMDSVSTVDEIPPAAVSPIANEESS